MRTLVAIPTYNEEKYVERVLARVLGVHPDVLVIDDGSKDRTPALLAQFRWRIWLRELVAWPLADAFRWAA